MWFFLVLKQFELAYEPKEKEKEQEEVKGGKLANHRNESILYFRGIEYIFLLIKSLLKIS
jgi:hypothetical protein